MKTSYPIKDKLILKDILTFLKQNSPVNYHAAIVALNTGLRIGDILKLKVKDFKNKTHVILKEQKTGKHQRILINKDLHKVINKFIKKLQDDHYVFSIDPYVRNKPITRDTVHKALNRAAKAVGYDQTISPHSLRKSFGRNFYEQTNDIRYLQQLFNHSHPAVTSRYLMLDQDELDKQMQQFSLTIDTIK